MAEETNNNQSFEGFIPLMRRFKDNPLWMEKRKFSRAEAWIDLLFMAHYGEKPSKLIDRGEEIIIEKGEILTSIKSLSEKWRRSQGWVKALLELLKNKNVISVNIIANRRTIIKIVKYDYFQNLIKKSGTVLRTECEQNENRMRHKNKGKKEKKEKKEKYIKRKKRKVGETPTPPSNEQPTSIGQLSDERKAYLTHLLETGKIKKLRYELSKAMGDEYFFIKDLLKHRKKRQFGRSYIPSGKSYIPSGKSYPVENKSSYKSSYKSDGLDYKSDEPTYKPVDITDDDVRRLSMETFFKISYIKDKLEAYKLWVKENNVKVRSHYDRFKLSFLMREKPDFGNCNLGYFTYISTLQNTGSQDKAMKAYLLDLIAFKQLTKREYWDEIRKRHLDTPEDWEKAKKYGFVGGQDASTS